MAGRNVDDLVLPEEPAQVPEAGSGAAAIAAEVPGVIVEPIPAPPRPQHGGTRFERAVNFLWDKWMRLCSNMFVYVIQVVLHWVIPLMLRSPS